jgi:hypothetical protein
MLSLDLDEPYEIPTSVAISSSSLEFMKKFVTAHNYNPGNIRIKKPLKFEDIK